MDNGRTAALVRASALAGAGCLALSGTASADLVGAEVVNQGDIGAGVDSYAIYVLFDDPSDQLLAICGDAKVSPLIFDSPTPLVQHSVYEGRRYLEDVPSIADLGGDSWVALGHPQTHDTFFSPGFLPGDYNHAMIRGTHFEVLDDGCYFDREPGTPELPDEKMRILVAQFSLDLGPGERATYQATASFLYAGGDLWSRPFAVVIAACPADIDGNDAVDFDDLLRILEAWGHGGPEDLDGSGTVDFHDLLILLEAWGPCA